MYHLPQGGRKVGVPAFWGPALRARALAPGRSRASLGGQWVCFQLRPLPGNAPPVKRHADEIFVQIQSEGIKHWGSRDS